MSLSVVPCGSGRWHLTASQCNDSKSPDAKNGRPEPSKARLQYPNRNGGSPSSDNQVDTLVEGQD